ncbi:MAG: YdaS family helix-turn-helix protein [Burkholderiales bacterium]
MKTLVLEQAVALCSGQSELARRLRALLPGDKVSQVHVWKWLNRVSGPVPPAKYVIPICQAVEWQITPNQMRPDLYPFPHDGLPLEFR